jgi:hypothetical protein
VSTLRQWDVVLVPYPTLTNPHYLVLLSPDALTANPDFRNLNGLVCSILRPPDRPLRSQEIHLNGADSFEHRTVCRCHLVIEFARDDILTVRGKISPPRRLAIKRRLREIFDL